MKRIILEWGLNLSVGMALALLILWVGSEFFDPSSHHLAIPTSRTEGGYFHLIVSDGDFSLSNQCDVDASGNARPLIIDARSLAASDIRRGDRLVRFTVPGIDLRHYRFAPSGNR